MKLALAQDWMRSKTMWGGVVPAVVTALGGWATGELRWWQAAFAIAGAFGVFGVRDTTQRHELNEAARHAERMGAVARQQQALQRAAQAAQQAAAAAPGAEQRSISMEDLVRQVKEHVAREMQERTDREVLGSPVFGGETAAAPTTTRPTEPEVEEVDGEV